MNRESLRKHCEKMCKMYESAPSSNAYMEHKLVLDLLEQTDWIPVSDRLPEKEGNYITTVKSGGFYRVEGESIFEVYGDDITHWAVIGEVIAWMPLPEPYKAESEETHGK